MKITYSILYKNGHEDIVVQPVDEEGVDIELIKEINATIQEALREDMPGEVTLGELGKEVTTIKLSEVVRVNYQFSEE